MRSDWERENEQRLALEKEAAEAVVKPPAFPRGSALLPFEVAGQRDFRHFVDGESLSVEEKAGVVRYTVVARSPGGVENISYEGLRCATGEFRIYALGRADGTWAGRPPGWQPIREARQPHIRVLQRDFFCPQSNPIADAAEGRRALQQGGHPWAKGFSGDALRR